MPKVKLTPARIAAFTCDAGKQTFLWDVDAPGLAVRITPAGVKSFIFESRLAGKTIRITIGEVGAIVIEDARNEARRLALVMAQGIDPREQKRQIITEQEQARAAREQQDAIERVKGLPLRAAWEEYLAERKPRWGERNYHDHITLAQEPGRPLKRGKGILQAGPLYPLLNTKFSEMTPAIRDAWLEKQVAVHPTMTALSWRLFKTFWKWCETHKVYGPVVPAGIVTRKAAEVLPKRAAKNDCLQKEQLAGWFQAVRQLPPVTAAYLQTLLLTGARRGELAELKWTDVDFKWKSLTIKDKVEDTRVIPLTPYVDHLLRFLPHRNEWVFSSPAAATGRIQEPRRAHNRALLIAGIDELTIHGLRRSFGSLAEWLDIPAGIVAQIMGHKPSAIAERHYRVRPLDLLRQWHSKLEEWILEQDGLTMPEELPVQVRKVAG
jgi:integrase